MPKKTRISSKKTQSKSRIKSYNFFIIFAVILGMIAGVMMVKIFYQGEPKTVAHPTVTVGVLEYDFSSGKAVKRDDPKITSLRAFLENAAAKDCSAVHDSMEPSQFTVIASTKDISQVLLGYGCGDVSARMFAVRKDQEWKFISPTNHFDPLTNLPECSYVSMHKISKTIAPVCYTATDVDSAVYSVR